eukprot:m.134691 g.134691  ORF g.134691 m.134691 type:complete len:103 (+) comp9872_c0_seq8:1988-2296(+)
MIPSSTVTVINVIVPYVFTLVSKLELRSDEARDLQVTLLRAVIFRVAVVGTYIAHFFRSLSRRHCPLSRFPLALIMHAPHQITTARQKFAGRLELARNSTAL